MRPVSPAAATGDQLALSITADGKSLDSNLPVIGVDVWSTVNAAPTARVVLLAGSPPDEPFSPGAFGALQPGKAIEIGAGYDLASDAIFSGIVVMIGFEAAGDGAARVVVDAAGQAVATTDAGTVTVEVPDQGEVPELRVTYGESIIAFKAEIGPGPPHLARPRGQVSFPGSALARCGSMIELHGVGGRFNDCVAMRAVHHEMTDGQWTTTVEFGQVPDALAPADKGKADVV